MSDEEFARFQVHSRDEFATEKERAGLSPAEARSAADGSWVKIVPQGRATPGFRFETIREISSGKAVGSLWWGPAGPDWPAGTAFIYDIVINPGRRGEGLAREALQLLEQAAKREGFTQVGLHVFGHNVRARAIYEAAGFRTIDLWMLKDL
jgi:ribosomal protein S18 acetylase RimI-like enzyme